MAALFTPGGSLNKYVEPGPGKDSLYASQGLSPDGSPMQTASSAGGQQVIYTQAPARSAGDGGVAIANANRAGVLARGRQATLLTGGGGVSDTTNNQRKSLLGE